MHLLALVLFRQFAYNCVGLIMLTIRGSGVCLTGPPPWKWTPSVLTKQEKAWKVDVIISGQISHNNNLHGFY